MHYKVVGWKTFLCRSLTNLQCFVVNTL